MYPKSVLPELVVTLHLSWTFQPPYSVWILRVSHHTGWNDQVTVSIATKVIFQAIWGYKMAPNDNAIHVTREVLAMLTISERHCTGLANYRAAIFRDSGVNFHQASHYFLQITFCVSLYRNNYRQHIATTCNRLPTYLNVVIHDFKLTWTQTFPYRIPK